MNKSINKKQECACGGITGEGGGWHFESCPMIQPRTAEKENIYFMTDHGLYKNGIPLKPEPAEKECECCGGDIKIANPTGYCNHVYYPENCGQPCQKPEPEQTWDRARLRYVVVEHTQQYSGCVLEIMTAVAKYEKQLLSNQTEKIAEGVRGLRPKLGTPEIKSGYYNSALDDVLALLSEEEEGK